MTSAISREEADKIGSDFEKIASRDGHPKSPKSPKSNIKIVLIVVTVLLVVLMILLYVYLKNPNNRITNRQSKLTVAPVDNGSLTLVQAPMPQNPQAFQNYQMQTQATGTPLFGGQPIDLS